jgi:choline dehydrogenase-like flavoprotein
MSDFDVCIIGSGAGGGPVALQLANAGHHVVVLEKGPFIRRDDFYKDEMACCRRSVYTPRLAEEMHVIEDYDGKNPDGSYKWSSESTYDSGWDFWNGNMVGGATNVMSGFFYRMKPEDFRLKSEFGPIKGANVADWPITYEQLEPYYTLSEKLVGISGKAETHPFAEPRSTTDFPYPPTREHPVTDLIDNACYEMNLQPLHTARAILPHAIDNGRRGCEYSGYCGSYGCSSGAKGSSREALIMPALATGRCEIRDRAKVIRIRSDKNGKATSVEYIDKNGVTQFVSAKIFVVACQAVETARLLLLSTDSKHPDGLGNRYSQVGKNLLFSAGGSGYGEFIYNEMDNSLVQELKKRGPFINRGLQDWYIIDDKQFGPRMKGGTVDFLLRHPNPIARANSIKWNEDGALVWGSALKTRLKQAFTDALSLRFEIFCDWLPTDDCFVSLDNTVKDKWSTPAAKIRIGYHDHDIKVGNYLLDKTRQVMDTMGTANIRGSVSGTPPQNLQAGGCRFGKDPKASVLDADCRIHTAENVFVTDGSWIPTGGSVPYTWTIYANAFRVADIIKTQL